MMSLLGVLSRYNKTIINYRYHFKTNFTTRWGTFTCHRIPFGIINVGATFQREVHIAFNDLKRVIIHIFLDDLTMHYNMRDDFFDHLKQMFLRCKKFGISFMSNQLCFGITEGKLLGYTISKDHVSINPKRILVIQYFPTPTSNKYI